MKPNRPRYRDGIPAPQAEPLAIPAGILDLTEEFRGPTNLGQKGSAKSEFFVFVVRRRVVEFAFSQFVERDAHESQLYRTVSR